MQHCSTESANVPTAHSSAAQLVWANLGAVIARISSQAQGQGAVGAQERSPRSTQLSHCSAQPSPHRPRCPGAPAARTSRAAAAGWQDTGTSCPAPEPRSSVLRHRGVFAHTPDSPSLSGAKARREGKCLGNQWLGEDLSHQQQKPRSRVRRLVTCRCHEFAIISKLFFVTDQVETPSTGHRASPVSVLTFL